MVAVMKVGFVKMHGAGNDFVMIDDREEIFPLHDYMRVAAMASRPGGIGCEGVIFVQKSSCADFRMRFFNPDGSEAEMCGNGARCVAAFAKEIGAVRGNVMCFETAAGLVDAEIVAENQVKVWMPDPKDMRDGFVNSGVPHKVVEVDNLARTDVESEGRRIRLSEEFAPEGTNVDFVVYRAPDRVSIRTYERGVEAETGACGTGSVAAALVGVAQHGLKFPVHVKTVNGYDLTVDGEMHEGKFRSVTLTGPVKKVYEGIIDWDSIDIL